MPAQCKICQIIVKKFEKDVFYRTDNSLYWIGAILSSFFPIYTHFIVLFVQMSVFWILLKLKVVKNTFSMAANVNSAN